MKPATHLDSAPFPAPAAEPMADAPLVDMHCHTAGIGAGGSGCFVSAALAHSYKFGLYLRSFGVTRAELERQGDALVVDRIAAQVAASRHVDAAVILALDGVVDARGRLDAARTEMYVPNEFVAKAVARHPHLRLGASVNPHRRDARERLAWAKAQGAVLLKWLPAIQHIDPADPQLGRFYRELAASGLPLLTHTGTEHSFTRAEDAFCDPARLERPLAEGVTVIAAHAASTGRYQGERAMDRLARLMVRYPNLYADISALTLVNRRGHLREVLRREEFRGRLLYGTDFPLVAMPALVSPWYHPLPWRERRTIAAEPNAWDRDVLLKRALGVPADVWRRAGELLGIRATAVAA